MKTRIAKGIYQDDYGFGVQARVGTKPHELRSPEIRFPPGTSLATMQARFFVEKEKLEELLKKGGKIERGTLKADVATYFKTKKFKEGHRAQREQERQQQLDWWCEKFGNRRRATLTAIELQQALNTLHLAESTINKYRTALSNVYTVLDGKSGASPFRDIPREKEPEGEPRDVAYEFIQVLLAQITARGDAAAARLSVLAYAPVTKPQLEAMTRADVAWTAQADGTSHMYTPGRKKGAGTKGKRKPLSPQGLAAFREFDRLNLWGHVVTHQSLNRTFIRARNKALAECRQTMPDLDLTRAEQMTRKDLRHSFGTLTFLQTGDATITKELLDHKDLKTTLRYAKGALPEHLRKAGQAIAAAFAAIPPYVPPPAEPKKQKGVELPRSKS